MSRIIIIGFTIGNFAAGCGREPSDWHASADPCAKYRDETVADRGAPISIDGNEWKYSDVTLAFIADRANGCVVENVLVSAN